MHTPQRHISDAPTPLGSVVALTFITSIGTGLSWHAMFFIAEQAFGYTTEQNLVFAIVLGLVYVLGAWQSPRITSAIRAALGGGSTRAALGTVLAGAAAVGIVPLALHSPAGMWIFGVVYIAASGLLWPMIESYISGGRNGPALRRAMGAFNISWASSLMLAMWGIAPFLEEHALLMLAGMAPLHFGSLFLLRRFSREPAGTDHQTTQAHADPRARALLGMFRTGLFLSYVVNAAIAPALPQLISELGVAVSMSTVLASTWMVARLGAFVFMTRSHSWHGKRSTGVWSLGLMFAGAGVTLVAPSWQVMAMGLAAMGAGIGAVYAAAIYYAMAAGPSRIEGAGKHEAIIGLGYTLGPCLGWLVAQAQ